MDPDRMEREAVLAVGRTRQVYEAIEDHPGTNLTELSETSTPTSASSTAGSIASSTPISSTESGRAARSP
jgi:hypothetical protein